jgi:hypothetical protein
MVARKTKTAKPSARKKRRPTQQSAASTAKAKARARPGPKRPAIPSLRSLFDIQREIPLTKAKRVQTIRQNAILERMGQVWNRAGFRQRLAILKQLIALRALSGAALVVGYVELGRKLGTLRNDADIQHAARDWFGGYFVGPVVESFVAGSILGAQRSLETGLPIAFYWVAAAGEQLKFAVAESPQQITILLLTPPEPNRQTEVRELRKPERLWVVAPDDRGTGVAVQQVFATAIAVK